MIADDAASGDRWHDAFDRLHARLLRGLPGDASELPPPEDEYWARQLDEILAFAAQLARDTEHEAPQRQSAPGAGSWLLTAVGESMTHDGPLHEAAELAERSWIAHRGKPEGDLVWLRRQHGVWQLPYQEGDGSLIDTKIKVRAR